MPLVVHCPKCQAKLRGPDEMAGRSVRCKSCQEKFRVPGGDTSTTMDNAAETQQLSVVGSGMAIPAIPPPAAPVAGAPRPPAGTADDPLPLDDLVVEEPPKPAIPLGTKAETVSPDDLILEDAPKPTPTPFSFDEPVPETAKKKKRRDDEEDEEDRPRKKKRRDEDDEPAEKPAYRARKTGPPWGILIGLGVLVLALGGGAAAVFLMGDKKKEEAKATTPEPKTKSGKDKTKGDTEPKGTDPTPGGNPVPGKPMTPVDPVQPKQEPPKKKEPPKKEPPKKEPPPPAVVTLPEPPAGALVVVGKPKAKVTADVPADKVRHFAVGNGRVVVAFNSKPGFQGAGVTDTVRQFSVATGAKGREFEIDSSGLAWPRPFAISSFDEMVAAVSGGPTKVTAFDFDGGNRLFDKLDVYDGLADRVGPVAALALGANRKLFVVDQAGTVDVWDMATRQRAVTGTPAKRTAPGKPSAKACVFSAGAAVAVAVDGKVLAYNSSGALIGRPATLPDGATTVLAMGSGAGLDQVAVAYALPGGKAGVATVHPAGGTVSSRFTLPDGAAAPTEVSWPADTLVAVATDGGTAGFILDTEARQVTAYLKAPTGKVLLSPTGGDFWWLTADGAKSALVSAEMPFDGYFDVAKQAGNTRRPVYLVPRGDGLAK